MPKSNVANVDTREDGTNNVNDTTYTTEKKDDIINSGDSRAELTSKEEEITKPDFTVELFVTRQ